MLKKGMCTALAAVVLLGAGQAYADEYPVDVSGIKAAVVIEQIAKPAALGLGRTPKPSQVDLFPLAARYLLRELCRRGRASCKHHDTLGLAVKAVDCEELRALARIC